MTVQMVTSGRGRSQRLFVNETVLIVQFQRVSGREERKYGPNTAQWPTDALPKIINVKEFVDSLASKTWFKEEKQWMKDNESMVQQQNVAGEIRWKKSRWRSRQAMSSTNQSGQPTRFNQSPTIGPGYQHAYPPTFPPGSPMMSPHVPRPGAPRPFNLSTSLGAPEPEHTQFRSGQAYPGSYHPYSKDKNSGS